MNENDWVKSSMDYVVELWSVQSWGKQLSNRITIQMPTSPDGCSYTTTLPSETQDK